MRTVAIVQARLGSYRLPGKALLSLRGRPMLEHVLERVMATAGLDAVVLATSVSERDTALQEIASRLGVSTWRGSEWDVLGRVHEAARWAKAEVVMRVTADCPFWDPLTGHDVLRQFLVLGEDYVSNDTTRSGFPDGLDVEVFTREALDLAAFQAVDKADREHVTPWMRRHLRCDMVSCIGNYSHLKLSVDRPEDLDYARRVAQHLPPGRFGLPATLSACAMVEEERRRR